MFLLLEVCLYRMVYSLETNKIEKLALCQEYSIVATHIVDIQLFWKDESICTLWLLYEDIFYLQYHFPTDVLPWKYTYDNSDVGTLQSHHSI